jgi:lysozyme family protein
MSEKVLLKTFELIMKHEGGSKITNDPKDPGGLTKYGVSQKAYPNLDIKNLTLEDASKIFKKDYWDKCKCDDLPDPLSMLVADCAYNSGVKKSAQILQKAVGATEDGIIGPKTIQLVKQQDVQKTSWLLRDYRLEYLKTLSTWKTYGNGWNNRIQMMYDESVKVR